MNIDQNAPNIQLTLAAHHYRQRVLFVNSKQTLRKTKSQIFEFNEKKCEWIFFFLFIYLFCRVGLRDWNQLICSIT